MPESTMADLPPPIPNPTSLALPPDDPQIAALHPPPTPVVRSLPSLEGWRGLAHYRTESRRNVVKKRPQDRTQSDLYILEESAKDVKLIGDLPLAKRLEICRYLGYERWDPNLTVYQQGAVSSTFYIVFTGLVRATVYEEGVQEDRVTLMLPGDCFGELALSKDDCKMTETTFTTERSELLTLTKKDYDAILRIEKTPELKERVRFLKSISAFSDVSKQSLLRLANVLTSRTYTKNRVVTFQGDESFEMFFVKAGECRIVMEITSHRKPILRLPRVSTFVYQYAPTTHHRCKEEIKIREKEWGRPSLVPRPSKRATSNFKSQIIETPAGLPDVILKTPDLLRELAVGHAKVATARSAKAKRDSRPSGHVHGSVRSAGRPFSVPVVSNQAFPRDSLELYKSGALSPWGNPNSPKAVAGRFSPRESSLKKTQPQQLMSFGGISPKMRAMITEEEEKRPISPGPSSIERRNQPGQSRDGGARFKKSEMQERTYQGKRRRRTSLKPKYTLSKFLSEVEEREHRLTDMDFSAKEHALLHLGFGQGVMKTGFSEDVKYYRQKFQVWARGVLNREKKLLGFNIYADNVESPSFIPGAGREIQKLEQGEGPEAKNKDKDTMILDIGLLGAGDYFGERGLLKKSRRAVSIVTISPVEVLVLNVWDFHRHCDRDVIKALSAHDYKKEEQIYKQYLRNSRWERFKKKVLDEVLEAKNFRTCMRIGARAMRYIPPNDGLGRGKKPPTEWKN